MIERFEALCDLLVESGDLTPRGTRQILKVAEAENATRNRTFVVQLTEEQINDAPVMPGFRELVAAAVASQFATEAFGAVADLEDANAKVRAVFDDHTASRVHKSAH